MSTAASIALIFLILQAMFGALIILALFAGMVFLMAKLRGVVKRFMPRLQGITFQVANTAHLISDKVAAPFIAANAAVTQAQTVIKGARRLFSRL